MRAIGVIPARYASTRFPGKPLARIAGRPLLEWVVEAARSSRHLAEVIVATDDDRIRQLAESLGVEGVMTSGDLPSGSDRAWAAVGSRSADVIVNIQGDEPLITGQALDSLIAPFQGDPTLEMATLARNLSEESLHHPNVAKVVINRRGEAIYFSRFPIPHSREGVTTECISLKHIGIYAYRKVFLGQFCSHGITPLEQAEGLEQLRALYLGARIRVVRAELETWGVDAPEDVIRVEELLKKRKEKECHGSEQKPEEKGRS